MPLKLDLRPHEKVFLGGAVLINGDSRCQLTVLNDVPLILITEQALDIANSLIAKGIIPAKAAEDALHIAIATVNGVDYLLTWNCRHIANPEIQRGIAAHLEEIGLSLPFICTPEELLGDENVE